MLPVVGLVTRESNFNNVDFPAPFLPIIPTTSPWFISRLMSFNAQTYWDSSFGFRVSSFGFEKVSGFEFTRFARELACGSVRVSSFEFRVYSLRS